MPTIADAGPPVTGGVDTHAEVHVAGVADQTGRVLGVKEFPATAQGYAAALAWMRGHGDLVKVGVEGTGSYGAGLARYLAAQGIEVAEVMRPNRQARRRRGKSDAADAIAAALAALNGEASGQPKSGDGAVESIRALQVARRHQALTAEIAQLDTALEALLEHAAPPGFLARTGVGARVAAALLVTTGDNPGRLRTEASFAALCGASPVDASSGKQRRHRLNRGGDRQANSALWRIVFTRIACDPRTQAYVARRTAEGKTTREIIRCLKRYVAREVYKVLTARPATQPAPATPRQIQ